MMRRQYQTVGDPIDAGGVTIIPVTKVSIGYGGGSGLISP